MTFFETVTAAINDLIENGYDWKSASPTGSSS